MGISDWLQAMLFDVSASTISDVIIIAILALLIVALFQAYQGRHTSFLEHAPSVMTSLGILGTFAGIVIGLLHFNGSDTSTIDESIPLMLEGLKVAFTTSLVGMFSAILFKATDAWYFAAKRERLGARGEATPNDIHSEITHTNAHLEKLILSMAGSEEGSLVGQLKLARSEISDATKRAQTDRKEFSERLWTEMREFADLLSKSATEQVIEALRQVIVDFNRNLTEQFGDNFKRLDESVKKLVEWQAQYMQQLEQMSEQYAQGVKAIDSTKDAVLEIGEKTAEIPVSMQKMQEVLQVNQHQIQELQRHLEAFVTMRDKAVEAVPIINEQLSNVGEKLTESARQMGVIMLEGATEFKGSVQQTNSAMQTLANTMANESESISETLKDASTEMNKTTRDMLARLESGAQSLQSSLADTVEQVMLDMQKQVRNAMSGIDQEIKTATSRTGESIHKQIDALDQSMNDELNRVMQHMGTALATIAQQFTTDYSKLVEAMNQVVRQRGDRQ